MRKILIPILLIVVGTLTTTAQNQQVVDSMRQLLTTSIPDTLRIQTYANLSWAYASTRTKLDTATFYADSMVYWSDKAQYPQGKARAQGYYSVIAKFEGNYAKAIGHMEQYVDYYQSVSDSNRIAYGLYEIGVMKFFSGDNAGSLAAYQHVLEIYRHLQSTQEMARILHAIGHVQRKIDSEAAIESYQEAIVLWKELDDLEGLSMSTEGIGGAYEDLGQYQPAEEWLTQAHEITKLENRPIGIASTAYNLGVLLTKMDRRQEALSYHLQALQIRRTLASKKDIALSLNRLGELYLDQASTHQAQEVLDESLALAQEIQVLPLLKDNYQAMSRLKEAQGDYPRALFYQRQYTNALDSLSGIETNKRLAELETQYQLDKRDQEITLLNKENQLQATVAKRQALVRQALLAGLMALLVIIWLVYRSMRQRLKHQKSVSLKDKQVQEAKTGEELRNLEMKALRAQMNPHFLFNSLNAINTMILKNEQQDASQYLTKFSKLVRQILENSEESRVSLKDELEMLNTYIQLESIRFGDQVDYEIKVADSLDSEAVQLPSMVIQPFVENAIWHGLLKRVEGGQLLIDIEDRQDFISCTITDNGVGRQQNANQEQATKKRSMGINITQQRLKLLAQQTVEDLVKIIDLKDAQNQPVGTQVQVLIPVS